MKITSEIVALSAKYVCDYYAKYFDWRFTYHNLTHTTRVVSSVDKLCKKLSVRGRQKRIVEVAGWFHDTGYSRQIQGHETIGGELANNFLKDHHIDEEEIAQVRSCILSTHYPQHPCSQLEQILCDADLMHLAARDLSDVMENLRLESHTIKRKDFSDREWLILNIKFLSAHHFHTSYGKQILEKSKEENCQILINRLKLLEGLSINKANR
jgi:predicted metal-dependent HD superfamily phosphohydrolase